MKSTKLIKFGKIWRKMAKLEVPDTNQPIKSPACDKTALLTKAATVMTRNVYLTPHTQANYQIRKVHQIGTMNDRYKSSERSIETLTVKNQKMESKATGIIKATTKQSILKYIEYFAINIQEGIKENRDHESRAVEFSRGEEKH